MLTIFCGYDKRESIGFHVFANSVIARASIPVALVPCPSHGMTQGTNEFTYSRFLSAYRMQFSGKCVFADAADMVCLTDVAELQQELEKIDAAVGVVKHDYKTAHPIKYRYTEMESPNRDYARKNWASLMLINCEHPAWQAVTPESLNSWTGLELLQFKFLADSEIQSVSNDWNVLVDENQSIDNPKILHWTAGIPGFEYYSNAPMADVWREEWKKTVYPLHTHF
jgi:hypothetical protein